MHRYHIMTNKNNVCSLKNMIMQNRTFSLATMKTLTCITNKLVLKFSYKSFKSGRHEAIQI